MFVKCFKIFLILTSVNAYFDAILDRCEVLEQDKAIMDWSKLKVKKINKTVRALSGQTMVYKQLDDNTLFEGLMYRKMGGDYKLLPFKLFKKPFCQSMKEEEFFWPEAVEGFNLPGCPVPIGNYSGDAIFKGEKLPQNALHSGDYAFELLFTTPLLRMVLKFRLYATIIQI